MACSGPFEKPDKAPNWAKVSHSQTVSLLSCVPSSRWMRDDDDDDDDDDGDDDDAADDDDERHHHLDVSVPPPGRRTP